MRAGRLMLDVQGTALTDEERSLLRHPEVGGLILFTRNYRDKTQLKALIADIRQQQPEILIAVDHEGGRVQRFREGFVRIPPMGKIAALWQAEPERALALARETGWLMAAELVELDIDISFAPVLDLNWARSEIIGDRAFGDTPAQVVALTSAFMQGMHEAGMAATGKHFPGHGWVVADSHVDIPRDERSWEALQADIEPFQALVKAGLDAIMPAHVIYEQVDTQPAGFSAHWLQTVLRNQLGFNGVIFSDDLTMEGATVAGSYAQRAEAALVAGCDMVLVCNNPQGARDVLHWLAQHPGEVAAPAVQLRKKSIPVDPVRFAAVARQLAEGVV